MDNTTRSYRVIGRNTPKVDGIDKVTGQAKFGADFGLPLMLKGKVLRSPFAHARVKLIDTSKAEALPGVKAVVTRDDLPAMNAGARTPYGTVTARDRYLSDEILAKDTVKFHGHAVAAVAAISSEIAEEALGLIEVEYEELPHVLDPVKSMEPDAVRLHGDLYTTTPDGQSDAPSNVAEHMVMGRGDVEQGFAQADVVVEKSFRTQSVHQGYIEIDCETAHVHADGSVEVWTSTQATYAVRAELAILLEIPLSRIRVTPTEIGGGFGGKESVRTIALSVALSKKAGLPVRITLSREEVFRATGPGNATNSTIKIGALSDGTITAIQANIVFDAGAYPGAPLRSAVRRVFSHYRTPNLRIDAYDVVTNKPHVVAYRAPGATPTAFAVESVIDEVSKALDMDVLEFRLKNVSRSGNPMPDGTELSSIGLVQVLEKIKQHPCWTTPLTGRNRGRGLAVGMWTMPGGTTSCHIILNSDGSVTLVTGAVDLSATRTSLAMVAAESLGLDMDDVQVVISNTDSSAHSDGSAGDKITYVTSKAVIKASLELLNELKRRAADEFGVSLNDVVYDQRRFWTEGVPEMSVSWDDLALRSIRGDGAVMGFGSTSEVTGEVAIAPNAAAHVVDVEVDPDTGKVEILNYTTFQDAGLAINPEQVEGQMQGGATQGIGWALSEEYVYSENGELQNATLLDYRLQTSLDVPSIGAEIVEVPSDDHPLGIRAVGQVPIVPPAGAIGNAIRNAIGVRMTELPMNPERVFWALQRRLETGE